MGSFNNSRPLAGIKVIDFGQYIAGPGTAMALVELGADVIKVEPLGGDQARHIGRYGQSMVRAYNRGKRSIAIDLKSDTGREVALRLISDTDVLIQNLRPGVMKNLKLDALTVRSRWPRIVYLSISGFSGQGPSSDRPGYDIAAQAESGLMSLTGEAGREPQKVGVPIIDAAAAQIGAQAVLAALFGREKNGHGATIETSLFEVAMHLQATAWSDYLEGGVEPTRIGNGQQQNAPAAEVIPTLDGYIVLSAYADEHWKRLCQLLGKDELSTDARFASNEQRVAHRGALCAILSECLSGYNSEECVALLTRHQIVAGSVRSYSQVLKSADLLESGLIVQALGNGEVSYRALALPYQFESNTRPTPSAAPLCGADTDEILTEIGLNSGEIAQLREIGAIA